MKNTILITGVTGTLGNPTAKELARKGISNLILAGRNIEKLENVKKELIAINPNISIKIVDVDLSSIVSVKQAIESIKKQTNELNGILNIAAVYKNKKVVTKDGLEFMFATNHLGPFHLTAGLLKLLKNTPNSRVITVTAPSSTKLNFDDMQSDKTFSSLSSFGQSKMENLLFTYKLAREFEKTSSEAFNYFPGLMKSELMREMPPLLNTIYKFVASKPDQAARSLAILLTDERFKNSNGKFFNKKLKEIKSSTYSYDIQIQDKLWSYSKALIGKEYTLEKNRTEEPVFA